MQNFITIYLKQIDYFHINNGIVTDNKMFTLIKYLKWYILYSKNLLKKEDITKTKHQTNSENFFFFFLIKLLEKVNVE